MKSDVITISSSGNGFQAALAETKKVATYQGLDEKESLRLQLITEEILSLARSIAGETQASFWLENEGPQFSLHLSTSTIMDKEKRYLFISVSSTRKNEAAKSFLGYLRDAFENAMLSDTDHSLNDVPYDILADVASRPIETAEWDGYEKSVLRKLADQIKISIRGNVVDMTVTKRFAK